MKSDFYIDRVGKEEIKNLLYNFHYLKDESKDFKSGYNYGLFQSSISDILHIGDCLAACVFTKIPVPEIAVGAFGLQRHEQEGLYELSRLCVHPDIQKEMGKSNHPEVQKANAIFDNPHAKSEHISNALEDIDPRIRSKAIQHPNVTKEHITKALDDSMYDIRKVAEKKLGISK